MDWLQDNLLALISLAVSLSVALASLLWRARFDVRLSDKEQETAYEIGIAQSREAWSLQLLTQDVDSALSALWEVIEWAEGAHGFMTLVDDVLATESVPDEADRDRLWRGADEILDAYPTVPNLVGCKRLLVIHCVELRLRPDVLEMLAPVQWVAFCAWRRAMAAMLASFPEHKNNPGATGDWRKDRASYDVILDAAGVLRDLHLAIRLSLADAPWQEAPLAGWSPLMGESLWLRVEDDQWTPTVAVQEVAEEGLRLLEEEKQVADDGG